MKIHKENVIKTNVKNNGRTSLHTKAKRKNEGAIGVGVRD